jgi:enoyl-CoA hydratase
LFILNRKKTIMRAKHIDAIGRRDFLKATAALSCTALVAGISLTRADEAREPDKGPSIASGRRMADVPKSNDHKITIERRDQIVLIGINRPYIQNRLDPEAFAGLARAYFDYDRDPSLRAAVLFGHGPNFSQGIDVEAFKAIAATGKPLVGDAGVIDPLAKRGPRLSKPLVVVAHGDTWNMGHELHLVADIRVAAAATRFLQDENTHGRMPGGGSTVRFVREAGWANGMRYMLTGDHWNAEKALRIGEVQEVAKTPADALALGLEIAEKICRCGPLGIKTTLASAHLAVDPIEADALSRLDAQYGALYRTRDYQEGRKAEAEHRLPVYQGR